LAQRLEHTLHDNLSRYRGRLQFASQKLRASSPAGALTTARHVLYSTQASLTRSLNGLMQQKRTDLQKEIQTLHVLSPLATLARGYATLHNPSDNRTITSVHMIDRGQKIIAHLRDGELDCLIENITKKT
jgi:exodeoxyribonuclease VII large subunit